MQSVDGLFPQLLIARQPRCSLSIYVRASWGPIDRETPSQLGSAQLGLDRLENEPAQLRSLTKRSKLLAWLRLVNSSS
jgi:hypothetical protein